MTDCPLICLAAGASGFPDAFSRSPWLWLTSVAALLLLVAVRRAIRKIRTLETDLKRVTSELQETTGFLTRFSNGIWQQDGVEGVMHAAALNVAECVDAESVGIYELVDNELRGIGICGPYPLLKGVEKPQLTPYPKLLEAIRNERYRPGQDGIFSRMFDERTEELVADAAADPRFAEFPHTGNLHSVMIVPLFRDEVMSGVICAVNNRTTLGRPFSADQLERLLQLRTEVLMVQDLMQVYSEISRRDRIDQELGFARSLQQSLLPKNFPRWGEFEIDAHTRPAKEVNGDFYDCVAVDDDRLLVMIGDACGKGVPACMLSAMTRSFARSMTANFSTLNQFLRDLNDKLHRDTDADRFITLGCCLLDRRHNLLEFGRAGHTDLVGFIHNHIRVFSPDGTALGILPDDLVSFDTICISIDPESQIMMFSDGLCEATDKEQREFGRERLIEVYAQACKSPRASLRSLIDEVMKSVADFEAEQGDDQTIIMIRRKRRADEELS